MAVPLGWEVAYSPVGSLNAISQSPGMSLAGVSYVPSASVIAENSKSPNSCERSRGTVHEGLTSRGFRRRPVTWMPASPRPLSSVTLPVTAPWAAGVASIVPAFVVRPAATSTRAALVLGSRSPPGGNVHPRLYSPGATAGEVNSPVSGSTSRTYIPPKGLTSTKSVSGSGPPEGLLKRPETRPPASSSTSMSDSDSHPHSSG